MSVQNGSRTKSRMSLFFWYDIIMTVIAEQITEQLCT